jgi:hypothetical protein
MQLGLWTRSLLVLQAVLLALLPLLLKQEVLLRVLPLPAQG